MKTTFNLSPKDDKEWQAFSAFLATLNDQECTVTIETKKQRTGAQRRSIELFCKMLAGRLNETGMDMVRSIKILRKAPEVAIPWSQETVKDFLWRPVQKAMFDVESTRDLTTIQVDQVQNVLNKNLADKLGVSCDFPSRQG